MSGAIEGATSGAGGLGEFLEGRELCLRRHDEIAIDSGGKLSGIGHLDEARCDITGLGAEETHGLDDAFDAVLCLKSFLADADQLVGDATDRCGCACGGDAYCTDALGDAGEGRADARADRRHRGLERTCRLFRPIDPTDKVRGV